MRPFIIIWDFDGTLLPNEPHDSEQTLMLYKLHETGEKIPFFIRALARILLYADQKEHLRKVFKRFYIRFMIGTTMDIFKPDKCIAVGDGYTDIPMLDWAKIPVLVDRTGRKQIKYANKNYRFVRSLPEILEIGLD